MTVRELVPEDRGPVYDALVDCGAFNEREVATAMQMVDDGLRGDYSLLAVEEDERTVGYTCFGHAILTESSWYVYWICVHPSAQRRGAGRKLQTAVEEYVRASGGTRIVLETSGRAGYERTRRFYRDAGFCEVGRIPSFYKPGDDCVVYCKLLL